MGLYSLLLSMGLLGSSPWWLFRMLTTSRYRQGLPERLGHVPSRVQRAVAGRSVVWVHAVSVGEVLAVTALVTALEARLAAAPDLRPEGQGAEATGWRVVVSTTTRTGQLLARERFGPERVFWFPLDFAWAVRAWMRALQPRLVVLAESELWPRLLDECGRANVPVAVINARLSDRSFRRARRLRRVWGRVLRQVSLFLAQGEETAARLRTLGVGEYAVRVTGNLKYDLESGETAMVRVLRPLLGRRCAVVAGSLLRGEDALLLERWAAICEAVPTAVLVLAPRHPERFAGVAERVQAAFPLYRASALLAGATNAPGGLEPRAVVLLDTVGDLAAVYRLAEVAFVGGSLVRKGGHNPLEPARFGVPVLMGPSFENFREIVGEMKAAGGIGIVGNGDELSSTLVRLLGDRVAADELGRRGMDVFQRRRGATARTADALLGLLREPVRERRRRGGSAAVSAAAMRARP